MLIIRPSDASPRTGARERRGAAQRGQAIIWLLGTMAAAAAVMYGVFNIAQLNAGKERAVNAADAAALAGATVEARMLNLVAYNNRSIIANEVLLVQMLSIESWLGYFSHTANNFGTLADIVGLFIPPIEAIGKFLDESADIADEFRDGVGKANDLIITALEASKTLLGAAHQAVQAGGGLMAGNAATELVQANRSQFGTHDDKGVEIDSRPAVKVATLALNNTRWIEFTKRYSGNQRGDAKQVLLASRDDFSANRPGLWYLNLNAGLVGDTKLGGSQLQNYDRWETEDTLEVWVLDPVRGKKDYTPIGWGRANADKNGNSGGTWSPNRSAQSLARSDGGDHSHKNWSGVPSLFDIADKTKANRDKLHIDFLVAVRRPQANTLTTSQIGMSVTNPGPQGSSEMNERLQGDQLSALAKARVVFERPQRGLANDKTGGSLWRKDSAKEYGSLYSPYWQARVADLTTVEKAGLMAAMGIDPLLAPLTPGGQGE